MTKAEFSECIKKAQNKFDELILSEAKKSLRKKVCGYMIQETKTVTVGTGKRDENDEPVAVKEYTVTDKYFQPDTAAIIFTLTNRDPENWKNRINNELTGKDGENLFQGVVIQKTYEPDMKEGGGV
jgi:hypothetical protein